MSSAPARMITLKSSDEQTFVIEETVALQSETLEHMIADNTENLVIPLPSITGNILAKVIEYCTKHAEVETSDEDKTLWDAQFMNAEDRSNPQLLREVVKAADFLSIKGLLELTCKIFGGMINGKTPEQIHLIFHPRDQWTPEEVEEDAEYRRQNPWAFR
ncbi:hypothetical protein MKW94_004743 [Papaver nudicaule]|uniref:SKP1-like protein n=1 Tax=Papaver nudicaule TaxID=74823 RepID=A0AA41VA36_PAPNU|nr:hypothetical protein [Papaver nudicaule]